MVAATALLTDFSSHVHLDTAKREYLDMWREMDDSTEVITAVTGVSTSTDACVARLAANNVFLVAHRAVNNQVIMLRVLLVSADISFLVCSRFFRS